VIGRYRAVLQLPKLYEWHPSVGSFVPCSVIGSSEKLEQKFTLVQEIFCDTGKIRVSYRYPLSDEVAPLHKNTELIAACLSQWNPSTLDMLGPQDHGPRLSSFHGAFLN